ncbi:glycosyltransferase family 2 protein [Vibrio neptunius]|uniref:glycosyltransferase family 2 protein n=1 Tax=Vibrio neptunius TaxID=170651 RepID=UPI003314E643
MKIIAAMRVKNEEWVIKYTLHALSEFVDGIVILDDGSTDKTVEICKSFPKVLEICENKSGRCENDVDEAADWNKITNMALRKGAEWILYTDADEMLEPEFANRLQDMMSNDSAGMYRFRKISPWKSLTHYRTDSPRFDAKAETTLNPVLVRASASIKWDDGRGGLLKKVAKRVVRGERFKPSLGRGFPSGIQGETINDDTLVSLHFNHLDIDRLIRKQVFYALVEKRMKPYRSRDELVSWVARGWSEDGMSLTPVDEKWFWPEFIRHIEVKK